MQLKNSLLRKNKLKMITMLQLLKRTLKSEITKLPPLKKKDNWLPLKEELKLTRPSSLKDKLTLLISQEHLSLKTETTKLPPLLTRTYLLNQKRKTTLAEKLLISLNQLNSQDTSLTDSTMLDHQESLELTLTPEELTLRSLASDFKKNHQITYIFKFY